MTSILFQLAIAGALSASLVEAEPTFSVLGLSDPGDRIHELLAQPGSPSDLEVETPAVEVAGAPAVGRTARCGPPGDVAGAPAVVRTARWMPLGDVAGAPAVGRTAR